jgi:hypothetical protein
MSETWTFGVAPLDQTRVLAPLLREVAGLALSMESADPVVDRLILDLEAAREALRSAAPADLAPRVGAAADPRQRAYVDHSRDIWSYNPAFPPYAIEVDGATAHGTVCFPLAFEGPPGLVHGGVLGTFFDCVVQHHNCDVGVAGKTVSLLVEYRRPTPLGSLLRFDIERTSDDRRIVSAARLLRDDELLCHATVTAFAGDRGALPAVSPRREAP